MATPEDPLEQRIAAAFAADAGPPAPADMVQRVQAARRRRLGEERWPWKGLVLGGVAGGILLGSALIGGSLLLSITLLRPTRPPPAPSFAAEDVPAGLYREGPPPVSKLDTIDRQQDALIAALKDLEKENAP